MRPLDDLLVLDLTQFVAGPYCTMLLADAGARVIKIEPPGTAEPYRRVGPAPGRCAEWPAFAIVAEALGAIMQRIGEADCEPHWSGVSLGDIFASVLAATGILTALHARDRSGEGQHVDISMYDGMVSLNERAI